MVQQRYRLRQRDCASLEQDRSHSKVGLPACVKNAITAGQRLMHSTRERLSERIRTAGRYIVGEPYAFQLIAQQPEQTQVLLSFEDDDVPAADIHFARPDKRYRRRGCRRAARFQQMPSPGLRWPHENPAIGVLLCASKDNEVVEYALSRSLSPALAEQYQTQLPDKQMLAAKLHEFYALNVPDAAQAVNAAGTPARKQVRK